MVQPKRIDLNTGEFIACGKTYIVEKNLSLDRYIKHSEFEKILASGTTLKGMFDKLMVLRGHLNEAKFVDSAVCLDDILRNVARVEEREPVIFRICALFINTADEDRAVITDDMISAKIKDWKEEGLDVQDFFTVALNSVSGFFDIYETVTRTIIQITDREQQPNQ